MFYQSIEPDQGLVMVQPQSDRLNAAIHMFFMNFDITTVWLDDDFRIVDTQLCRRWRPVYVPAAPARFVLEIHAARKDDFLPGDHLSMETC